MTLALELAQREMRGADWQWRVVEAAMFAHAYSPDCVGWTFGCHNFARCGKCEWQVSARDNLGDDIGRARFALIAIGLFGIALAQIIAPVMAMVDPALDLGIDRESFEIEFVDGKLDVRYTYAVRQLVVVWKADV